MQDFPGHLPVYCLFGLSKTKSRLFSELIITELLSYDVQAVIVKAKITVGDEHSAGDRAISTIQPDGICQYSYYGTEEELVWRLASIARTVDIVLVESDCVLRGLTPIVLDEKHDPAATAGVELHDFESDPQAAVWRILHHLQRKLASTPVWACILMGGKSSRMGQSKHLLKDKNGLTWLEKAVQTVKPHVAGVALSGAGKVPAELHSLDRLPDIPQIAGPLTGIISAMRWQPDVSWLLLACDMPEVTSEAVSWLLSERKTGVWASVPVIAGGKGVEPLFARYDPQSASFFEQMNLDGIRRISAITRFKRVNVVTVPNHLKSAWRNINTPDELHNLTL